MPHSYPEQLEAAIRGRAARYPATPRAGRFGLLTTVYVNSDPELFRETADCLRAQTTPFDQWVILAHGPIPDALDAILQALAGDARVRVLRHPVNLGIMGGMRMCLEAAETDYVVPVDSDDLLTPDALQVLSAEIDRHGRPAMLYSDEDLLIEGQPRHPYWRPDWDPVLNLASSYIWHLCCIRRDAALAAELYTDAGATWCHDWDTSFRIARREPPVHVREVLYHWRQHPASTTNTTEGPSDGSRQSTRYVLERFVAQLRDPSLYVIDDFPIFRGAPEWYVLRRPQASPPVATIGLGGTPGLDASTPATRTFPLQGAPAPAAGFWPWRKKAPAAPLTASQLLQALAEVDEPHVLLLGPGVAASGDGWWWEAVKLFECHPEVALVAGALTDARGAVLRGIEVWDETGRLLQPTRRQPAKAGGPFALWLKPQCVDAAATDFCFLEAGLLRRTLESLPGDTPLRGLGLRLAVQAQREGRLTAFSPLVAAQLTGPSIDGDPDELPAWAQAAIEPAARAGGRRAHLGRYD